MSIHKCSHCGEVFHSAWSEEEADQEAKELWGDLVKEPKDTKVVCDPCFKLHYDPRLLRGEEV